MKLKYILIGIIAISLLLLPSIVQADVYGDKTCNQGWLIPNVLPLYICYNTDGGMDHSFLTYEAMNSYYTPPLEEVYIPETTYLYVEGGSTETFSGD